MRPLRNGKEKEKKLKKNNDLERLLYRTAQLQPSQIAPIFARTLTYPCRILYGNELVQEEKPQNLTKVSENEV